MTLELSSPFLLTYNNEIFPQKFSESNFNEDWLSVRGTENKTWTMDRKKSMVQNGSLSLEFWSFHLISFSALSSLPSLILTCPSFLSWVLVLGYVLESVSPCWQSRCLSLFLSLLSNLNSSRVVSSFILPLVCVFVGSQREIEGRKGHPDTRRKINTCPCSRHSLSLDSLESIELFSYWLDSVRRDILSWF